MIQNLDPPNNSDRSDHYTEFIKQLPLNEITMLATDYAARRDAQGDFPDGYRIKIFGRVEK